MKRSIHSRRTKNCAAMAAVVFFSFLTASIADAAITVTSTGDAGGSCPGNDCTLRQAVLSAGISDTITFALPAGSVIELTNGQLLIDKNLKITGPGAKELTVRRSAASANFRIFNIIASRTATISGLTIGNGSLPGDQGGGVYNQGTLTLTATEISNNTVGGGSGGGISNAGTLTMNDSTVSGNTGNFGGGIFNGGMLTIISGTIAGNTAPSGSGAGISNVGSLSIFNSTVTGNAAQANGSNGGGIQHLGSGTATLRSTIVALNTVPAGTGPDIAGTFSSQGYNFIGNNSGGTVAPNTGDQIGTAAAPKDPLLGPLQDNGGPTRTCALRSGSPAIDTGAPRRSPPTTAASRARSILPASATPMMAATSAPTKCSPINSSGAAKSASSSAPMRMRAPARSAASSRVHAAGAESLLRITCAARSRSPGVSCP